MVEADADAEDGREEDRGGVEGDGEVLGGDRDGLVGQRREAIPCWRRNLGERTRILEGEYFFFIVSRSFHFVCQIADIMAATELEQPSMAGYDVTQGR